MRFYSVLLSSVLLASTVLADTRTHRAGATITSPSNGTFAITEATFTIPSLSGPVFGTAQVYVGLDEADGSDCFTSFKVGVDLGIGLSGPTYRAWYQSAPSPRTYVSLGISQGDSIHIGYTTLSDTTPAHAFIVNNSNNSEQPVTVDLGDTCGRSITWGMSALQSDGGAGVYYNIANFGTLTLTSADASSLNGQTYHPQDPVVDTFDMVNAAGTTQVTTKTSGNTVTFQFVQGQ